MRLTRQRLTRRGSSPSLDIHRRPYKYALALVLVVASLIALILLLLDHTTPLREKVTEVGAGLAASIIFALIYTVLANREYSELIRTEIASQLADHLSIILHQITQLNQLYLPTDRYAAVQSFDARFNRDLTRDLSNSKYYFFRGTSAKYVPARLLHSNHRLEDVKVLMVDPRDRDALNSRAQDLQRRPAHAHQNFSAIEHRIRKEILTSLIALFDCRRVVQVEIAFAVGTSTLRVELFDSALYLSLYQSADSRRNTHPDTVRYGRDSQQYEIYRDECRRQFQRGTLGRTFTARDDDADLLKYLSSLNFDNIDAAELTRLRTEHKTFLDPFIADLSKIGVDT
jgi:hypothetical protein